MADLTLTQLRHFAQVASTLHFSKAADNLEISQSTLSRSIRSLEDSLDAILFERSSRGVALTPAGRRHLELATQMLDLQQSMVARAYEDRREADLVLGIGHLPMVEGPAGMLIDSFVSGRPEVRVFKRTEYHTQLLAALDAGEIDAAFLLEESGLDTTELAQMRLTQVSFCRLPVVAVLPPDHYLARAEQSTITPCDLVTFPLRYYTTLPGIMSRVLTPAFLEHSACPTWLETTDPSGEGRPELWWRDANEILLTTSPLPGERVLTVEPCIELPFALTYREWNSKPLLRSFVDICRRFCTPPPASRSAATPATDLAAV